MSYPRRLQAAFSAVFTVAAPGLLENDEDADGDSLVISSMVVTSEQGATIEFESDGGFTYSPIVGVASTEANSIPVPDSFLYEISDGTGGTSSATVTIPFFLAQFDSYIFARGSESFEPQLGSRLLLDNDIGEGLQLVVPEQSISTVRGGQVELTGDGRFSYTPAAGLQHWDDDRFVYDITDGRSTSSATVRITIQPGTIEDLDGFAPDVGNGFLIDGRPRVFGDGGERYAAEDIMSAGDVDGDGFIDFSLARGWGPASLSCFWSEELRSARNGSVRKQCWPGNTGHDIACGGWGCQWRRFR